MTIERMYTTERSSQITIHGETVYLAGQVARGGAGRVDRGEDEGYSSEN